jgi:hypothetical protein
VVFSAGYLANVGLINALTGGSLRSLMRSLHPEAEVFSAVEIFADELVHSSLLDGITNFLPNPTEVKNVALDLDHEETPTMVKADAMLPTVAPLSLLLLVAVTLMFLWTPMRLESQRVELLEGVRCQILEMVDVLLTLLVRQLDTPLVSAGLSGTEHTGVQMQKIWG